jgi:tetratricopeptide (TPR) repeat protein
VGEYLSGKTLPPTDRFDELVRLLGAGPTEQGVLASARDRVAEVRRGPAAGVPRQLPADIAAFAGRRVELAALDRAVGERSVTAVVAISGTAGVGKTALAVRWAHGAADRFPGGQLYVNLRGFHPDGRAVAPADALRGFLDAFDVPAERVPSGLDAQAALYRTLVAGRRLLVVLDNARDAEQVRPLLPGAASAAVLVTSRDRLTELVTEGARALPLGLLTDVESYDLLAGRLDPGELAGADAVVAACAGLPLALAIVAAHAAQRGFPLAAELAELDPRDPGQEVTAVFSWSYERLDERAAGLFRLLGLHPGPQITVAAASSLLGAPAGRPLAALARASLLVEPAPGRYALHDLLAGYAGQLAAAAGDDRAAATARLVDHYPHTAYAANRVLRPERDPIELAVPAPGVAPERFDEAGASAWFRAEHAVLLGLAGRTDPERSWQLAWALETYLDRGGYWADAVAVWRAALSGATGAAAAHAYRSMSWANTRLGNHELARGDLGSALDLYVAAGDATGQAHTHNALAYLSERLGDPRGALDHAERALALYRAAGHASGEANALSNVGWFHAQLGDHAAARDHCERALAMHEKLGDRWGQAAAWDGIGYAYHHLGDHRAAEGCYRRTIALAGELGDRYGEATTWTHLGDTREAAGDRAAAREAWQRALDLLTELGHADAALPADRLGR